MSPNPTCSVHAARRCVVGQRTGPQPSQTGESPRGGLHLHQARARCHRAIGKLASIVLPGTPRRPASYRAQNVGLRGTGGNGQGIIDSRNRYRPVLSQRISETQLALIIVAPDPHRAVAFERHAVVRTRRQGGNTAQCTRCREDWNRLAAGDNRAISKLTVVIQPPGPNRAPSQSQAEGIAGRHRTGAGNRPHRIEGRNRFCPVRDGSITQPSAEIETPSPHGTVLREGQGMGGACCHILNGGEIASARLCLHWNERVAGEAIPELTVEISPCRPDTAIGLQPEGMGRSRRRTRKSRPLG